MKNKKLHKLLAVLIIGCVALGIAGCSGKTSSTSTVGGSDRKGTENIVGEIVEEPAEEVTEEETEISPEIQKELDAAQECVGKTVDEMKAACGEPNNSEYEDSPSPEGGKIGFYYYDNFTISTKVAADGSETVDGVW